MIKRDLTEKVLQALTYFPAVGIIGPRQVGKTTLLKLVQPHITTPVLYLDLERDSDRQRLAEPELFLAAHADKCVIIDEVQVMPNLLPLLRWLIDQDRRPARFLLTGSASPDLIRGSTETLAGRIAYFELTPFSLPEVASLVATDTHWFRGGFPEALLAPTPELSALWLENFVQTFLYRDVRLLGHEITIPAMERLLKVLASYNGQLIQYEGLCTSVGISLPTLKKYLDILEGSFLLRRLQPHLANLTKRLVRSPKLYLRDTGLLHRLLGVTDLVQLQGSPWLGASWEGYVIEQIARGVGKSWDFTFFRTQRGAEVDLLLKSPSGKLLMLEIKYSVNPSPARGFYEAATDLQPDARYVLIPGENVWDRSDGLRICGLLPFLEKELAKFG